MKESQLALNYDKFQLLILGKTKRLIPSIKLEMEGHTIAESTQCKILELILNNKLDWRNHILSLIPKLRKTTMILKRIKNTVSNDDLRKLAVGTFISKIQYGITVYGNAKLTQNDPLPRNTARLQVMTNKMMRLIKPGRNTVREWGAEKLCTHLKFLSVNQMVIKFKLLEIWKCINMENYPLSEKISTILNKNISKSQIITRSTRNNTLRPEIGSKLQKSNLLGQGAYLWNEAPLDFKTAKTYQNAKKIANRIAKTYPIK